MLFIFSAAVATLITQITEVAVRRCDYDNLLSKITTFFQNREVGSDNDDPSPCPLAELQEDK